jgi:hypothetical protein
MNPRITFEVTQELKDKIVRIAKSKGISVGALVRMVFSDMEEKEKK